MVTITVEDVDEPPILTGDDPEDYDENGPGPVATFIATDPEGAAVIWEVEGTDAASFTIEGGVLMFKSSPNFEAPKDGLHPAGSDAVADPANAADNNEYVVTVKATEVRAEGDTGEAQSSARRVVVTVTNVDEDGMVDLSRLQPQVDATGLTATLTDPDGDGGVATAFTTGATWLWSVPKVARPELDNDEHWQPAGGTTNTAAYTPHADDKDEYLRVKVVYTDGEGALKDAYMKSDYPVRAAPIFAAGESNADPVFDTTAGIFNRELPEDTAVDANVGAPVTAMDANTSDILTYVLGGTHGSSFAIDKATGQITVAAGLDFEGGGASGVYTVTVTAYDAFNDDDDVTFTITTTDVNEVPSVTGREVSSVAENVVATSTPLGTYTPSDLDAGDDVDDLTLSLSGEPTRTPLSSATPPLLQAPVS